MSLWDAFTSALCAAWKKKIIGLDIAITQTGYESMKNLPKLLTAILQAYENPDFRPVIQDGKITQTFCNAAVHHIAGVMGCNDFERMTADEIFTAMHSGKGWQEVKMRDCQFLANQGSLVIAALPAKALNDAHGHVCVVRPGEQVWSEHWKSMVPAVMNVGGHNFILRFSTGAGVPIEAGVNGAFQIIPHFFAWEPSL